MQPSSVVSGKALHLPARRQTGLLRLLLLMLRLRLLLLLLRYARKARVVIGNRRHKFSSF